MARDAMEKDYQQAFDHLRECLQESPENPACLILHHLRKPKSEDRQRGRSLGYLMSGSYTSSKRSAQRANFATCIGLTWTTIALLLRLRRTTTASWGGAVHGNGATARLRPSRIFDWQDYDLSSGTRVKEPKVRQEHLEQLFEHGKKWFALSEAVRRLQAIAKIGRTAAYDALKTSGGRFSDLLFRARGREKSGLPPTI